jgi:acetyl esterase
MRPPVLGILTSLLLCFACAHEDATIPVDDSYTVSQRYYAYSAEYPDLRWPTIEFAAGQKVAFDRRYKTVGERELHMDVFIPSAEITKHHGILLVHGGAWRSGNKSHFFTLANLLSQRGYTVFLPEYRLAPEAKYPAGLVDINDAIVWVKEHADDFDIDPSKIALGGGSSGGQMAALIAYASDNAAFKSHPNDDTHVSALVDLDGVLDFMTPLALQHENAAGNASPAALWLGGAMEKATDRWKAASAAGYVSAQSPPTLIISSGQARFTAGKEEVLSALEGYGIRAEYFEFSNVPHTFWLFDPYVTQVAGLVDHFLAAEE